MAQNKPMKGMGWIAFASIMMMVLGGFQIIAGLVAIFNNDFYVVSQNSLVAFNYTAWGWIDLVLGAILILGGAALMAGAMWARIVAVILAMLSLFANMAFLSSYPLWSILMIVFDVLIIHAIVVHGGELKE